VLDVWPGFGVDDGWLLDVVDVGWVVVEVVVVVDVGGGGAEVEVEVEVVEGMLVEVLVEKEEEDEPPPPPPEQAPNWGLQPFPQYSTPLPHQKNSEQQAPKREPRHVVWLPHMPLVVMTVPPEGTGIPDVVDVEVEVIMDVDVVDVEVEVTTDVDVDVVVVVGVTTGVELVVDVLVLLDEGALPPLGLGHPHAPKSGWHPILTRQ
jgi:hypothetical protein